MQNRREFLTRSGIALSGLASVGSATAESNPKSGVRKLIPKLLRQGKVDKAEKLAARHGVDYYRNRVTVGTGDDVSSDDALQNPNPGYIDFFHSSASEDREDWFTLNWRLHKDGSNLVDGSSPRDVPVIAWEDSQWGLTSLDDVYYGAQVFIDQNDDGDYLDSEYDEKPDTPAELVGGGLIGDYNNAIAVKAMDWSPLETYNGRQIPDEFGGFLQLKLRRQNYPDRSKGRVEMLYEHTWSLLDHAQFSNLLDALSITFKGAVSVDIPTGSDSWSERDDISK